MKTDTKKRIVDYIEQRGQVTVKEMEDFFGISRQGLFKHLPGLLAGGEIVKTGRPPKVFYMLADAPLRAAGPLLDKKTTETIEEEYTYVTPSGQIMKGVAGFEYWCGKQKLDSAKAAGDYVKLLEKYRGFKTDGLIDGLAKMKATFDEVFLDQVFYLDFYSIERFGKTKLGQLLLYAKQSQDKALIKEIAEMLRPRILDIIKKYKIDRIGFIPPSVKREVQLMKELEKRLKLDIPTIKLIKVKTPVTVPQKTLSKLEDRIENASKTIIVEENTQFRNLLLIDDAVGSGATLNETARSIRRRKICKGKITGLALVGSFKGFDVVSEV